MSRENVGPALFLWFGRSTEARDEPLPDEWVSPGKGGGKGRHWDYFTGNAKFRKTFVRRIELFTCLLFGLLFRANDQNGLTDAVI